MIHSRHQDHEISRPSHGINSREFNLTAGEEDVLMTDFSVIDTGPRIAETYRCVRSQPALDPLFANGFE